MYFLLKMGTFQCHVSFQGCNCWKNLQNMHKEFVRIGKPQRFPKKGFLGLVMNSVLMEELRQTTWDVNLLENPWGFKDGSSIDSSIWPTLGTCIKFFFWYTPGSANIALEHGPELKMYFPIKQCGYFQPASR